MLKSLNNFESKTAVLGYLGFGLIPVAMSLLPASQHAGSETVMTANFVVLATGLAVAGSIRYFEKGPLIPAIRQTVAMADHNATAPDNNQINNPPAEPLSGEVEEDGCDVVATQLTADTDLPVSKGGTN